MNVAFTSPAVVAPSSLALLDLSFSNNGFVGGLLAFLLLHTHLSAMAEKPSKQTAPNPRVLTSSTPSKQNMKGQKSILGFFQPKSSPSTPSTIAQPTSKKNELATSPTAWPVGKGSRNGMKSAQSSSKGQQFSRADHLTPAPSSDAVDLASDDFVTSNSAVKEVKGSFSNADACLPSPTTSTNGRSGEQAGNREQTTTSPSRRVRITWTACCIKSSCH